MAFLHSVVVVDFFWVSVIKVEASIKGFFTSEALEMDCWGMTSLATALLSLLEQYFSHPVTRLKGTTILRISTAILPFLALPTYVRRYKQLLRQLSGQL